MVRRQFFSRRYAAVSLRSYAKSIQGWYTLRATYRLL